MLEFLYAFYIPINELLKIERFLSITVRHAPLGQASYPLAGIPIPLLGFLDVFQILKKTQSFLLLPSYRHPQGRNAKRSLGWRPAACMTACHLVSPSSRSRHACLPSSPSYAAPLGQANYSVARILICFLHSHQ